MNLKVGQPIQYGNEDMGSEVVSAAQIVRVYNDGYVDLVYWDLGDRTFKFAGSVPHISKSNADRNEDWFEVLDEQERQSKV